MCHQRTCSLPVLQIFPNWTVPETGWTGSSSAGEGLPAYYLSMKKREGYDSSIASKYTSKWVKHRRQSGRLYVCPCGRLALPTTSIC